MRLAVERAEAAGVEQDGAVDTADLHAVINLRIVKLQARSLIHRSCLPEDTLDDVRTKLAELENEVGKDPSHSILRMIRLPQWDIAVGGAEPRLAVCQELSISVRHAVSGETLTVVRPFERAAQRAQCRDISADQVRARPSDTPAYLREHVLRATGMGLRKGVH